MRDLIWTLIIIWLVYQLINIFKKKPAATFSQKNQNQDEFNSNTSPSKHEDKIKDAIHKQADKAGEYVDFEEIK